MAKIQSFADKMKKGAADHTTHCQKCGESFQTIKYITSEKSEKTDSWKFNQRFVGLCKCNEAELTQ